MASKLHSRVSELMRNTNPEYWRKLSTETGLSFPWIRALAENRIARPSAEKLEILLKGLSGEIVCFGAD